MRSIAPPARRTFVSIIVIIFLLYMGYAYAAIAAAVLFLLSWFFFPARQSRDFCAGVIPAIDALAEFLRQLTTGNLSSQPERKIFQSFLAASSPYPEWVYRSGFNPGLRSGFRHFLIQLEHAADLCCSIAYWFSSNGSLVEKGDLMSALRQSLKINIELLAGLSRTMHHHAEKTPRPVNDSNVDFVSDVTALEEELRRLVPGSLELLDMSQEYVQMTALVRDVKDLREVLLLLVNALPMSG